MGKGRQMLDQGESWASVTNVASPGAAEGGGVGTDLHLSKQRGVSLFFYSKSIRMEGGKFEKAMKFESHVPNEK